MGFRFRKIFKLMPGVRINLSNGGVSTSVGRRGASLNFSRKGTRGTVGIPGSGLSYSEMVSSERAPASGSWIVNGFVMLVKLAFLMFLGVLIYYWFGGA